MDSQLLSVRQAKSPAASAAVVFVHGFGGDARATWQDFPKFATQGEAWLVLGEREQAYACYQQAADPALEATPRELESMYQQAIHVSRLIGDQSRRRVLTRIFRQG